MTTQTTLHPSERRAARALSAVALVATASIALSACSGGSDFADADSANRTTSSAPNKGHAAPHTVSTPKGEVTVPAGAQRVVVLGYRLTGLAFDLGAQVKATIPEQVGGVSEPAQAWRDAAGAQGTAFLPWTPEGFDIDAIRSFNPDLIIGGGPGLEYSYADKAYEDLSAIAPTVVIPEDTTRWEDQLEFMAETLGAQKRYDKLMSKYDGMLDSLHQTMAPPSGDVGYLVLDANEQPYALNETVGLPPELEKLGLQPAQATQLPGLQPDPDNAEVIPVPRDRVADVFDQDTLFVLGLGRNIVNPGELARDPRYADLPAIKNFRAFGLDYTAVDPGYDETMGAFGLMGNLFPKR